MKALKGNLALLLTAMIWGSAFVAQSIGGESLPPIAFNGIRTLFGGFVLMPVIALLQRGKKEKRKPTQEEKKQLLWGGLLCGMALFLGSTTQQMGLMYTTAGKSGFITAMYVVLVPVMGLFFKKRPGILVWIGVAIAAVGLYLLCINETLTLNKGDVLTLLCAFFFTGHIWLVDHFAAKVDGIRLSCAQFFVAGLIGCILMSFFEEVTLQGVRGALPSILYTGIFSCGIAYTLQIVGQKYTAPTVASLLMSLESVFAVLSGWLILDERLSLREAAGCTLMFAAIVLAQLPQKRKGKQDE